MVIVIQVDWLMIEIGLALGHDRHTIRKSRLLAALTKNGQNHLLGYQQQDAQEFFQFLSSIITKEEVGESLSLFDPFVLSIDGNVQDSYGIIGMKKLCWRPRKFPRNPFTGLLASRLVCQICGYQRPQKHDTFDNLSLFVPTNSSTSILALLRDYTTPEPVEGFICNKCSFIATRKKLKDRLKEFETSSTPSPSQSAKRKRRKLMSETRKQFELINSAIQGNNYEIDLVILLII